MRNMSFMLTTQQAGNKTKTVTRRKGWRFLERGDIIQQVVKGQGLKKGEKVERINRIKIVDVRREWLTDLFKSIEYGYEECRKEGFPDLTPHEFIAMFCRANKCPARTLVTRIEFKYI
jgi:hypothetical protein